MRTPERILKRRLNLLYYSPKLPTGFTGNLLALQGAATAPKRTTKGSKKYKESLIKHWLLQQDSYTLHKPITRKFKRRRVVCLGIDHLWEIDLIDVVRIKRSNSGYSYILVVLDCFSKRIDAVELKNKKPLTVTEGVKYILDKGKHGEVPLHQ